MTMTNQVKPFKQISINGDDDEERNSTTLNFDWSLRPLSLWLSLIGVDLPPRHRNRVIRWTAVLLNVILHVYLVVFLGRNMHDISISLAKAFSFTHMWNLIVDYANFSVHAIGVHLSLLIVTRVKWITFWSLLIQTASCISSLSVGSLPPPDAAGGALLVLKLRRFSYLGLAYILIQMTTLMVLQSFRLLFVQSSTQWKMLDLIELLTQIYSVSSLVLFRFVSRLVIDHFAIICQKLDVILTVLQQKQSSEGLMIGKMKQLQRQHELLCRSADSMNEIFGPILIFQIPFVFIGVINSSVNIFFKFKDGFGKTEDSYFSLISTLAFLVSHIANFSLLCHESDNLRNSALSVRLPLSELAYHHQSLESIVTTFSAQISQTTPQIGALGFFKIGKRLFPSLMGTTLTYFLIMCQFQSAENH